MAKIYETSNYDLFELHTVNRSVERTSRLEASMRKYGWIDAYPVHAVKNGGKLKIKAGHHRLTVAKKLGIPVKYVVCDDGGVSIHELENATNRWSFADYLESWCRAGKPDYIEIRRYCTTTGIPLGCAISMFGGNWAGSGHFQQAFKGGTYTIKNTTHPRQVADLVMHMHACGVECASAKLMVLAISKILFVDEFSVSTLKKKVKSHTHMLTKQANLQEYMRMLESVYNRQSKEKLPLAFLADEAAKRRNAITATLARKKAKDAA